MKKVFLILVLTIFITIPAFSQFEEEEAGEAISFTTYYPSPFGVYRNLLVSESMAIGDLSGPDGVPDGIVDINDLPPPIYADPNDDTSQLITGNLSIRGHVGIGTPASGWILALRDWHSINPQGHRVSGLLIANPRTDSYSVIHMTAAPQLTEGGDPNPRHQNWAIAVNALDYGEDEIENHFRICEGVPGHGCLTRLFIEEGGYAGNVGIEIDKPWGKLDIPAGPKWSAHNYGASLVIRRGGGEQRNNAIALLDALNSNPWAIANNAGNLRIVPMPALGDETSRPAYSKGISILKNGNVGIGTTLANPAQAKLDVRGEAKVGNSGLSCSGTTKGAMRYNDTDKQMEYCNGTNWSAMGGVPNCRICYQINSWGGDQCSRSGVRCSPWGTGGWTAWYMDDTDDRGGGCNYRFKIECR